MGEISGGAAAHYDADVAALVEVRIEDRLAGRAPALPGYLGESVFSTNPPDEMLY
jgi:hypothetical protein